MYTFVIEMSPLLTWLRLLSNSKLKLDCIQSSIEHFVEEIATFVLNFPEVKARLHG